MINLTYSFKLDDKDLVKLGIIMGQSVISILESPLIAVVAILGVWHLIFKGNRIVKLLSLADVTL